MGWATGKRPIRERCKRGHELNEYNSYKVNNNSKACKICYYAKMKAIRVINKLENDPLMKEIFLERFGFLGVVVPCKNTKCLLLHTHGHIDIKGLKNGC